MKKKTLIAASGLSQHYLNGLSDFAWFLKLISSVLWPGNNSITISFFCRMKIYALKLLSLQITEFQFLFFFFFLFFHFQLSYKLLNRKYKKTEIKYEKFNFSGRWHFSIGNWPKKKQQNKTNTKCFPLSFMSTISIVDGWSACTLSCALSPFEWNE